MTQRPIARLSDSSSGSILPSAAPVRHPRQDYYDSLTDTARGLLADTVPAPTRVAYNREWAHFLEWCAAHDRNPLPAFEADLVNWVADRISQRDSLGRIEHGISAVRRVHALAGYEDQPRARDAWQLHKRYRVTLLDSGWRPTKSATITVEEFRRMIAATPPDTASGIRDRALLAVGLSGFFRRSNITRLMLGDVVQTGHGDLLLTVTRSKTDQAGRGTVRTLPPGTNPLSDPVRLLGAWLDVLAAQRISDGPLFRPVARNGRVLERGLNPEWVRRVVKKAAEAAGLTSLRNRPYRGHTLRSSGVTMARRAGSSWDLICEQGDWSKDSPVVFGYEQPEEQDNAMRGVL